MPNGGVIGSAFDNPIFARGHPVASRQEAMMLNWKKLQSPTALVAQGFVAGGILFFTLQPIAPSEREAPQPSGVSVLSTLQG